MSSKFHILIASIKLWFKFRYFFFRRTIIKMADIMATAYQFKFICCCGRSNLVILVVFLQNFIYGLHSSNPGSSLNMSFVRQAITMMADKMAAAYQFASIHCCGRSYLVILIRFLPNFIYGLLLSNPGSSLNMSFVKQSVTKMDDKMTTAYQFASIRCCGHSNFVIFFLDFIQFLYMDCFCHTLVQV